MIKALVYLAGLAMVVTTDGKELLTNVLNGYLQSKGLEVEYSIGKTGKTGVEKCTYYTNGEDYFAETGDRVSLRNSDYFIVVDKGRKQISVGRQHSNSKGKKDEHPLAGMKDQLKDCEVTVYKGKDHTGIKLRNQKALISEVLYEVSEKEHALKRIQYAYNSPGQKEAVTTTISYSKTVFDRHFDRDFFSEKKIVKKTGKGFEITREDLKGYTIVDLSK